MDVKQIDCKLESSKAMHGLVQDRIRNPHSSYSMLGSTGRDKVLIQMTRAWEKGKECRNCLKVPH